MQQQSFIHWCMACAWLAQAIVVRDDNQFQDGTSHQKKSPAKPGFSKTFGKRLLSRLYQLPS
jgi:hypothetical protein